NPSAVFLAELRAIDLFLAFADQDAVSEIRKLRTSCLAFLDRGFEKGKTFLLERPILIGVLHEKPGGIGAIDPDQGLARPAMLVDDLLHARDVLLVDFPDS